jgi:hypothetical protein
MAVPTISSIAQRHHLGEAACCQATQRHADVGDREHETGGTLQIAKLLCNGVKKRPARLVMRPTVADERPHIAITT